MAQGSNQAFEMHLLFPRLGEVRRAIAGTIFLFIGLAGGGCASLPNVAPFAEATSQYRSAVVAGGTAVEAELRAINAKEDAGKFAKEWATRVEATNALVKYSDSLAAIVASGSQGAEAAQSVADSVKGLASAVGIALPPAEAVGVATDTVAFVYERIAAVRASQALGKALSNATPAVDRITTIMSKDLIAAKDIFDASNTEAKVRLTMQFNAETAYLTTLLDERKTIYGKSPQSPKDEERLLQINRLVEATRAWRDPMEAQERELIARRKAGDQLFNAARRALTEWSQAHRDLAVAVESGRKVDVTALIASIQEMRDLIKRIQTL
jgi:hypothetical protein